MLPRMIYLNGPKGCGKTTLAEGLNLTNPNGIVQIDFPVPLWTIADDILNQLGTLKDTDIPLDFTKPDVKGTLIHADGPYRWREFLVEQANVLRKYFGPTVLGRIAARSAKTFFLQGFDTAIFPNVRTPDDLVPLMALEPRREQVLIRIEREGATFENDNGQYIVPEGIMSITLSNNGTPAELITAALNFLEEEPPDADS